MGDVVRLEQSLFTVESDKASMEISSLAAGVLKELKVKLGDKVHEGSVVLTLETQDAGRWRCNSVRPGACYSTRCATKF